MIRNLIRRSFCKQPVVRAPETEPVGYKIEPNEIANHQAPPTSNRRVLKQNQGVPNFQFTLAQAGMVIASGFAILGMVKMGDIAMEKRKRANQTAIVSEEQIGKPKLGGPWTLYDCKTALPVTSESLRGKYQLIYFGFTYCPDICPEELEKQRAVLEAVDKALAQESLSGIIQPVFITVDPRRDTLAQIRMYVKEFHPKLLGLTGAPEQIKKVTRKFRVYYNEGIKTKNANGEEDYLVDHSIIHYLMGPENELVDFYGKNLNVNEMVSKIVSQIRKDHKQKLESKKMKA